VCYCQKAWRASTGVPVHAWDAAGSAPLRMRRAPHASALSTAAKLLDPGWASAHQVPLAGSLLHGGRPGRGARHRWAVCAAALAGLGVRVEVGQQVAVRIAGVRQPGAEHAAHHAELRAGAARQPW
jgi:hypothetical protein